MIQLLLLQVILIFSGFVHFLDPFSYVNAIPLFVSHKLEIIFFSGIFEVILALSLFLRPIRRKILFLITIYFVLILPINLHVAINGIPFHGIRDPIFLWLSALIQVGLIFWTYRLRKSRYCSAHD